MFGGVQVQERYSNKYDGLMKQANAAKAHAEKSQALPAAFTNTIDILLDILRDIGTIRQNKQKCLSLATQAVETVEKMKLMVESSPSLWETLLKDFNSVFTTIADDVRSIAGRSFLTRLSCGDSDGNKLSECQKNLESSFSLFKPQPPAAEPGEASDSPPDKELETAQKTLDNARKARHHQHRQDAKELERMRASPTLVSQQSADRERGDSRKDRKDLNNGGNERRYQHQRGEEPRKARSSPMLSVDASRAPNQGPARPLRRENSDLKWTRGQLDS